MPGILLPLLGQIHFKSFHISTSTSMDKLILWIELLLLAWTSLIFFCFCVLPCTTKSGEILGLSTVTTNINGGFSHFCICLHIFTKLGLLLVFVFGFRARLTKLAVILDLYINEHPLSIHIYNISVKLLVLVLSIS